jgi:transposase
MNSSCQKESFVVGQNNDQVVDILPSVTITKQEYLYLTRTAAYWEGQHKQATLREEILKKTIEEQKAKIRDLNKRLFGKKSEKKSSGKNEGSLKSSTSNRPRGQQPGSKGHGRTLHPDLKTIEEPVNFPTTPTCPDCRAPYIYDSSKESEIIEVKVKAYTRRIIRETLKKSCSCKGIPNLITAPMPPKVILKSQYGISIWEDVLLSKFLYCQPTNRLISQYNELGLPISPGTIAGGLKTIKDLFQPIYDALYIQQMSENRFHSDESGWKVFEDIDGKIGNRWWLWVCRSASVVFYQIAQGRGANVVVEHFENSTQESIIVVCDRYSAYKSLAKQLSFIILAFCWAHVRRDFLDAAKKHPKLEDWALDWINKIAELYHINNQRVKEFDSKQIIQWQSAAFQQEHEKLVESMDKMVDERDAFIDSYKPHDPEMTLLTEVKYKILLSLQNHWQGLSVFLVHPEVPMDNNKAESSIRNPVTGRKNFYGSGSLWSSQLAAMMFSIFQTIILCGLNCRHWLRSYLTACADNHGQPPEDLSPFLPWTMDEKRRQQLTKPPDTS